MAHDTRNASPDGVGARFFRSTISSTALLFVATLSACERDATTTAPRRLGPASADVSPTDVPPTHADAEALRVLAATHGVTALAHPAPV